MLAMYYISGNADFALDIEELKCLKLRKRESLPINVWQSVMRISGSTGSKDKLLSLGGDHSKNAWKQCGLIGPGGIAVLKNAVTEIEKRFIMPCMSRHQ